MIAARRIITILSQQCQFKNSFKLSQPCRSIAGSSGPAPDHPDDDMLFPEGEALMDFDHMSLAARGYLRNQKSYTPPPNVEELVQQACIEASGSPFPDLNKPDVKFAVLARCSKDLQHRVPSSVMHNITDADLLLTFYKTAIDIRVPLDRMKGINLPQNLHVLYKEHRFHPETDTMFKGVTAFTGQGNIITGLNAKRKYKGFENKPEWMKYREAVDVNYYGTKKKKIRQYAGWDENESRGSPYKA